MCQAVFWILRFEDYIKNSWMLMSETDGIWKCL